MSKQHILNAFREKFKEEMDYLSDCHVDDPVRIDIWLLNTLTEFERDLIKEIKTEGYSYCHTKDGDCHCEDFNDYLVKLEKEKRT